MRIDRVGRKRKKLEEKSTALMFRIDNKTLFSLCDKFNIQYDREAELVSDETKKAVIAELEVIIKNIVN